MELKITTCEQYVLNELHTKTTKLEEVEKELADTKKQFQYAIQVLNIVTPVVNFTKTKDGKISLGNKSYVLDPANEEDLKLINALTPIFGTADDDEEPADVGEMPSTEAELEAEVVDPAKK